MPIEFPLSETPCFFPQALVDELAVTGEELIRQSMAGEARTLPPKPSSRIGFADRAPVRIRRFCRLISGSCATSSGAHRRRGSSSCRRSRRSTDSRPRSPTPIATAYATAAGVVRVSERTERRRAIARSSATPSSAGTIPRRSCSWRSSRSARRRGPDFVMTEAAVGRAGRRHRARSSRTDAGCCISATDGRRRSAASTTA